MGGGGREGSARPGKREDEAATKRGSVRSVSRESQTGRDAPQQAGSPHAYPLPLSHAGMDASPPAQNERWRWRAALLSPRGNGATGDGRARAPDFPRACSQHGHMFTAWRVLAVWRVLAAARPPEGPCSQRGAGRGASGGGVATPPVGRAKGGGGWARTKAAGCDRHAHKTVCRAGPAVVLPRDAAVRRQ